jgi:hypothetical protein
MLPRRSGFRQLLEMAVKTFSQDAPFRSVSTGSREHDEVPRRQRRSVAERFARQALELVAVHGAFCSSARDRQTESRGGAAVRPCENREESIARARSLGEHSPELCGLVQALVG